MDSNILSIISLVVSVFGSILAVINHKRIRSNCCGKELTTSLDIESTTPPNIKIPIENKDNRTEIKD
jgi:hypothetical protein